MDGCVAVVKMHRICLVSFQDLLEILLKKSMKHIKSSLVFYRSFIYMEYGDNRAKSLAIAKDMSIIFELRKMKITEKCVLDQLLKESTLLR